MKLFEPVEHTADYALFARGRDLRELVESAGRGMISLLVDTAQVAPTGQVDFVGHGDSPEQLLLATLRELLYLEEDQGLVPVRCSVVRLDQTPLAAECSVSVTPIELARPQLLGHIKAVTYHDLNITSTPAGLEVRLVFDV